jgi:hypothetical protein
LTGYFPTRPQQINFDLIFQTVAGQWRLFGISIATPEAPPSQPQAAAPPAQPQAAAPPAQPKAQTPRPKPSGSGAKMQ